MVQWLKFHTPSAGAKGQSLVKELDPDATTKTWSNQINKNKYFLKL